MVSPTKAPSSARGAKGDDDGGRPRASRAAPAASGGLSAGAKVGLLTALVSALVLAAAVLPGSGSASAAEDRAEFDAMGSNVARAYAAALVKDASSQPAASAPASTKKWIDAMRTSVDNQLKALNLRSEARETLVSTVGVAMALALDPTGASAKEPLDKLIYRLTDRVKAEKDEDLKKTLIDEKNRLSELYQSLGNLGGGGAAPAAGGRQRLFVPPSASTAWNLLGIWVTSPKGDVVGEPPSGVALPGRPATATTAYAASIGGVPSTIYFAQGGVGHPVAYVAFADPPARGSSSNKLGLLLVFLGPLLLGGLAFASANGNAKPIKDLARELDRLGASGDPTRRIAARGPEASAVARSVERMVANLKFRDSHAMQDLSEVVSKEQELAGQIHHGLMPKDPPKMPGYEVETLFKPGFEIGGDHFDYFRIDDTHLGVILLDTSVRGIPAALVMAMARAYVRAQAPGVHSPAEVLMKVNRLLAVDLSQGQYVTALYVVIDTATGTAKVASAGHLPLVVYRHAIGKTAVVNPQGVALGLDVGPVFDREITEVEVEIGVGDRLVLHTDGALKVQNETGDEYGEARLYASIKQEAPKNSQAFVNFVGASIDRFHLETPQNDDITISTVKRLK